MPGPSLVPNKLGGPPTAHTLPLSRSLAPAAGADPPHLLAFTDTPAQKNINNTPPSLPSLPVPVTAHCTTPLDQVHTNSHPPPSSPPVHHGSICYISPRSIPSWSPLQRDYSHTQHHITFLLRELFTMSGANAWLQRQRKAELVELAQQSGLTKYVCTRWILLRLALNPSIFEFCTGFCRVLSVFLQL